MSDVHGAVLPGFCIRWTSDWRSLILQNYPPLGRLRSVGSQQRLSGGLSEGPPVQQQKDQPLAASQPTGSLSKWLLGLGVIAIVAVLHIFSNVSAQNVAEEKPVYSRDSVSGSVSVYTSDPDTGASGLSHASAKPTWASLGRLGHELLTQVEHATKPAPGQVDPYTRSWPNTIAICAIMKDERLEDVKEFIDYHRWVGVDTFYLRENGDECAIKEDLQPYVDAGVLDLGLLPGEKHPTQTNWYNDCSRKASKLHSWVAFVDLDEFIVVLRNKKQTIKLMYRNRAVTEKNSLKSVLHNSFRYTAAVSMQWVLFGSAGHKDMPPEGQLKAFNKCTGLLSKQMKCLGNTYWFHYHSTFRPTHVHQCNFRFGAVAVLGNAEPLNMWRVKMTPGPGTAGPYGASYAGHLSENEHKFFTKITNDYQVVLFHYVTRSQNSFVERKINRRSGVYATTYAELAEKDKSANQDTLYQRFEHEYGFDGTHHICGQGEPVSDAMQLGRESGWSPLPTDPGILGGKVKKAKKSGSSKG